uniref:Uncharacterized protein n=1 Tax=Lepeophtheirus salmonis TaxID=72036 RepID=A0A0K2UHH0_LEPSM
MKNWNYVSRHLIYEDLHGSFTGSIWIYGSASTHPSSSKEFIFSHWDICASWNTPSHLRSSIQPQVTLSRGISHLCASLAGSHLLEYRDGS